MNLGELRTQFALISGRADLSTAQTDALLLLGQKELERLQETPKSMVVYETTIAAGGYSTSLAGWLSVSAVRIKVDDAWQDPLDVLDIQDLLDNYPEYSSEDRGQPTAWAVRNERTAAATEASSADPLVVITMPPADATYYLRFYGRAVHGEWGVDGTTAAAFASWWSVEAPDILLLAALRQLDLLYHRNFGKAAETLATIQNQLEGVDRALRRLKMHLPKASRAEG